MTYVSCYSRFPAILVIQKQETQVTQDNTSPAVGAASLLGWMKQLLVSTVPFSMTLNLDFKVTELPQMPRRIVCAAEARSACDS